MSGILFWLLRPSSNASYTRLHEEIRSKYAHYEGIDYTSTQRLPYLQAVMKEGLRTSSNGHPLPRVCPGRMIDGYWIPAGVRARPHLPYRIPLTLPGPKSIHPPGP